ncbi:MAG: NUDIX hydrolase [Alphaproteobacteria bacterium]
MSQAEAPRGPTIRKIPEGDTHERLVCADCGYVQYDNPKIVVGAVCSFEDRLLLCRRAINPRKGFWVFPAGYLELNEAVHEGAVREVREEAGAEAQLGELLAVYTIARISQVQLIYRAQLPSAALDPGPESAEAKLFYWQEIPWDDLAFPTVHWALRHHREVRGLSGFPPRGNPPGESADYIKKA